MPQENESEIQKAPMRARNARGQLMPKDAADAEEKSDSAKPPVKRRKRTGGIESDDFYIPQHLIPRGQSVEWKTMAVLGKEADGSYQVDLAEQGWEPATVTQFPDLMPKGYKGKTIMRKGMQLMIRAIELTQEAKAEDIQIAQSQVKTKLTQIGQTQKGELDRTVTAARRNYEPIPVDE